MQTLTSYKVVYFDQYGDMMEKDFNDENAARNFAAENIDSILYRVQILGSIERI